jgi:hypothetical protein
MLHFIHIAKTGGTSLEEYLNENNIKFIAHHLVEPEIPFDDDNRILILLRNPFKRFVSCFNYYHSILNQNLQPFYEDINNINAETCLSPYYTFTKITKNYFFSPEIDSFLHFFKDSNHLAESLSCNDENIRKNAETLCNYNHFLGLAFYFKYDADLFQKYLKNIIWIGRLENIDEDILSLQKILKVENKNTKLKNLKNNQKYHLSKDLSDIAKKNLINFYKKDFEFFDILRDNNLLNEDDYKISS